MQNYINCCKFTVDDFSSDPESTADMEERMKSLKRLREENRLKHISLMNKIEEEQENQAYLNAEARAEIKKQREAADIDEVRNIYNSFAVFLTVYVMMHV